MPTEDELEERLNDYLYSKRKQTETNEEQTETNENKNQQKAGDGK